MMQMNETTLPKKRGRRKKISPDDQNPKSNNNYNNAASNAAPNIVTESIPPIIKAFNNNNTMDPSGLVFAVKSRPQPMIPEMVEEKSTIGIDRLSTAVRRTYEGKVIARHLPKFDLNQSQFGVASMDEVVEKGMPLLSQTEDLSPVLSTTSKPLPIMPELKVETVEEEKPPTRVPANPITRPKPRFYFKDIEVEKEERNIDIIAPHVTWNLNNSVEIGGQMHRSVRNKRKKEVFDPSDLFTPKKRLTYDGVMIKQDKMDTEIHKPHITTSVNNNSVIEVQKKRPVGRPRHSDKPPRVRKNSFKSKDRKVVETSMELCKCCKRYRNIKGQVERFAVCSACTSSYHPSCFNMSRESASAARNSIKWVCYDCKKCTSCCEQLGSFSVTCSRCSDGFHLKCLSLQEKPQHWDCDSCASTDGSGNGNQEDLKCEDKTPRKEKESSPSNRQTKKPKRRYIRKPRKDDGRRNRFLKDKSSTPDKADSPVIPDKNDTYLPNNLEPSLPESKVVLLKSDPRLDGVEPLPAKPNLNSVEVKPETPSAKSEIGMTEFEIDTTKMEIVGSREVDMIKPELVSATTESVLSTEPNPDKATHPITNPEEIGTKIFKDTLENLESEPISQKSEENVHKNEKNLETLPVSNSIPDILHTPSIAPEDISSLVSIPKSMPAQCTPASIMPQQPFSMITISSPLAQMPILEIVPAPVPLAIPAAVQLPANPLTWTANQVELYFRENGLRDEGAVFREQEIDGISLMLMRRTDITQGMRLKLGPALKVHRLVAELQHQSLNSHD